MRDTNHSTSCKRNMLAHNEQFGYHCSSSMRVFFIFGHCVPTSCRRELQTEVSKARREQVSCQKHCKLVMTY